MTARAPATALPQDAIDDVVASLKFELNRMTATAGSPEMNYVEYNGDLIKLARQYATDRAKLVEALRDMTYGVDCRKDRLFVTAPRWAHENALVALADCGEFGKD